jgi:hypothetical protein
LCCYSTGSFVAYGFERHELLCRARSIFSAEDTKHELAHIRINKPLVDDLDEGVRITDALTQLDECRLSGRPLQRTSDSSPDSRYRNAGTHIGGAMNFSQWWKLALSLSGTDPIYTSSSQSAPSLVLLSRRISRSRWLQHAGKERHAMRVRRKGRKRPVCTQPLDPARLGTGECAGEA